MSSLSELVGLARSQRGMARYNELEADPQAELGLPSQVGVRELQRRKEMLAAQRDVQNPRTAALIGSLGGAALGAYMRPGSVKSRLVGAGAGALGGGLGAAAGTYAGARLGEAIADPYLDREIAARHQNKAASVAEYSVLYDLIEEGQLGPHVKEAMRGVCEGFQSPLHSGTKTASAPGAATEHDARQDRLNQLLRR